MQGRGNWQHDNVAADKGRPDRHGQGGSPAARSLQVTGSTGLNHDRTALNYALGSGEPSVGIGCNERRSDRLERMVRRFIARLGALHAFNNFLTVSFKY